MLVNEWLVVQIWHLKNTSEIFNQLTMDFWHVMKLQQT